jgi:hypothetical protein
MRYFAGDAASVQQQITTLADEAQADEIMITTFLANPADRARALTGLAGAFGLASRAVG